MGGLECAVRSRLRRAIVGAAMAAGVLSLSAPPAARAEVPPDVGIAITFERGCPRGAGTLEVINETKGPAAEVGRTPVLWGRDGRLRSIYEATDRLAIYPISSGPYPLERGDRVVVRLLSADG
ncbi:MAG: hypothetical protein C0498_14410, partial [Anaerolinea sp.]|nr:hypothetical protein [Anaerolinea sp.]